MKCDFCFNEVNENKVIKASIDITNNHITKKEEMYFCSELCKQRTKDIEENYICGMNMSQKI